MCFDNNHVYSFSGFLLSALLDDFWVIHCDGIYFAQMEIYERPVLPT